MSLVRFAICALLFASPAVHADPVATVSIEPLFLVATMVDSTIEVKPTDHLGIAALAGYGLPVTCATLWDLGGQANVYLQRTFSGLHVGAELRYMGGSVSLLGTNRMSDGTDRILGAYVGYKWITSYGLSAILQFGIGRQDISNPPPNSDLPKSQVIPVGNLTVGWSF